MDGRTRACLLMLYVLGASAWSDENQLEFELGHGIPLSSVQANGSSDRVGAVGTTWSADILHHVTPWSYLGLGGGQFRSGDNASQTYVPNAVSTLSTRSSSILLLARQDLGVDTAFIPYLLAGIGWVRNSLTITAVPNSTWADTGTSEQRTLTDDSRSSMAYAIGAGGDWALTSRLVVGAEVRYQNAFSRSFPLSPLGQQITGLTTASTSFKTFLYSVKVGVKY